MTYHIGQGRRCHGEQYGFLGASNGKLGSHIVGREAQELQDGCHGQRVGVSAGKLILCAIDGGYGRF